MGEGNSVRAGIAQGCSEWRVSRGDKGGILRISTDLDHAEGATLWVQCAILLPLHTAHHFTPIHPDAHTLR